MRFFILAICWLALGLTQLIAQPNIALSDYILPISGGWQAEQTENFPAGESGENINWNFSNIQPIGNIIDYSILDPADTPFATEFTLANTAYYVPDTSSIEEEFETYQYYNVSNNTIDFYGTVAVIFPNDSFPDGDTIITRYNDPITFGPFPLTYGDTRSDVSTNQTTIESAPGQPFDITVLSTTTRQTTVDGYGSLITPAGSFENVLRLRTVFTQRDSIIGSPVPVPATVLNGVNYLWIAEDEPTTLLQVDSIPITPGFPQLLQTTGFYRISFEGEPSTTSNTLQSADDFGFSYGPNPIQRNRTLQLYFERSRASQIRFSLTNSTGRLVRKFTANIPAGTWQTELKINELPPGYYQLLLMDGEYASNTKIIITN